VSQVPISSQLCSFFSFIDLDHSIIEYSTKTVGVSPPTTDIPQFILDLIKYILRSAKLVEEVRTCPRTELYAYNRLQDPSMAAVVPW
jgi:hypothetical protein